MEPPPEWIEERKRADDRYKQVKPLLEAELKKLRAELNEYLEGN